MLNKTLISALVLAATTGSAFAMDAPSQGAAMLARTLGVEPGVYELSDLVRLDQAQDETNDSNIVAYILDEGRDGVTGRANTNASGGVSADQLALSLGVEPGRYTINELAQIDSAQKQSNSDQQVRFLVDGGTTGDVSTSKSASPARQQLAANLNLDAADFTLAQLVELNRAADENDSFTVRTILAEAGVNTPADVVLR